MYELRATNWHLVAVKLAESEEETHFTLAEVEAICEQELIAEDDIHPDNVVTIGVENEGEVMREVEEDPLVGQEHDTDHMQDHEQDHEQDHDQDHDPKDYWLSDPQRAKVLEVFIASERSYDRARMLFERSTPGVKMPARRTVFRYLARFRATGSVQTPARKRKRTVRTEDNIVRIREELSKNPSLSVRKLAEAVGLKPTTTRAILQTDIKRKGRPAVQNSPKQTKPKQKVPKTKKHPKVEVLEEPPPLETEIIIHVQQEPEAEGDPDPIAILG